MNFITPKIDNNNNNNNNPIIIIKVPMLVVISLLQITNKVEVSEAKDKFIILMYNYQITNNILNNINKINNNLINLPNPNKTGINLLKIILLTLVTIPVKLQINNNKTNLANNNSNPTNSTTNSNNNNNNKIKQIILDLTQITTFKIPTIIIITFPTNNNSSNNNSLQLTVTIVIIIILDFPNHNNSNFSKTINSLLDRAVTLKSNLKIILIITNSISLLNNNKTRTSLINLLNNSNKEMMKMD